MGQSGAASGRSGNLTARVATAAVLAPVVVALVWLGGEWVRLLALVVALICLGELYTAMRQAALTGAWPVGVVGVGALVLLPDQAPLVLAGLVVGSAVWCGLVARQARLLSFAFSVGGALYVGVPMALAPLLRAHADGMAWCALVLAGVWLCDSAAYFAGSRWGRHKLWPQISPRKSWEGLVAGLAAASLAASVFVVFLPVPPQLLPLIGLALGAATVVGDLAESAVKRLLGVKDMGGILPGHGGLFDRIDGLLVALPVGYVAAWLLG